MTRTDYALEFLMRESYNPHRMVWTRVVQPYDAYQDWASIKDLTSMLVGLSQCLVNEWVEFEFQEGNDLWVRLTYAGHLEALKRRAER